MTYSGRCACGRVTLAMDGNPLAVGQCWCRQCQQIAAGGATVNALFPAHAVSIAGETAKHAYAAASGSRVTHWFCPSCGTPLLGQSAAHPDVLAVKLGAIDLPHDLRPGGVIWTSEAPVWAFLDDDLPQHPFGPNRPRGEAGA